jgi:hypothetical protein
MPGGYFGQRTSQNSVTAKFAEDPFHDLRRCRSEPHTSRARKRKVRIFEPSRGFDTPLTMSPKNPRFLCRSLSRCSIAPQRRLRCPCRVTRQLQRMRRDGKKSGRLVFSEPKNASRRTVGLPQRAVSTLKSHRKRQLEEKLQVADYEDSGLVFASSKGTPIDAQNVVNRYYKPLLKRAGLPPIRFHDLRHSCLSLLAQHGEPIRDLQALAGHATASFTLQRYTHHYDSSARRTANAMGEILSQQH